MVGRVDGSTGVSPRATHNGAAIVFLTGLADLFQIFALVLGGRRQADRPRFSLAVAGAAVLGC